MADRHRQMKGPVAPAGGVICSGVEINGACDARFDHRVPANGLLDQAVSNDLEVNMRRLFPGLHSVGELFGSGRHLHRPGKPVEVETAYRSALEPEGTPRRCTTSDCSRTQRPAAMAVELTSRRRCGRTRRSSTAILGALSLNGLLPCCGKEFYAKACRQ